MKCQAEINRDNYYKLLMKKYNEDFNIDLINSITEIENNLREELELKAMGIWGE